MKMKAEQNKNNVSNLFIFAFLYFLINAFSRYALSSTANLDQAEQLVLSQSWLLGYSSQPPLYTWLIYALFSITDQNLLILIGVKVILLSALVGILISIGKCLAFTKEQQFISLLGLAFVPQYIWESQRDLSHSLLATVIAAATLLQLMRIRANPSLFNYSAIGLLFACGLISKYNYGIFLLSLIIAALLSTQYRQTIMSYRSILSIIITVALIAPHTLWAINNVDIASSSIHKFKISEGHYLGGVTKVVFSLLNFLTPFWIISLLLFKDGFKRFNRNQQSERKFITTLLIATMAIVLTITLLSGAQNIKARWYQPLLFYLPLLLALHTSPSKKNLKIYCAMGVFSLITIAIAIPLKIIFAERVGGKARSNIPYQIQATHLASLVGEPGVIISETKLIGGNMRLFFKSAQIITPDFNRQLLHHKGKKLILCETKDCQNKEFQSWLLNKHKIDINTLKFNKIEAPYHYLSKYKHFFYWAETDLFPKKNDVIDNRTASR